MLAVYGAFDGASAWALRIAIDETAAQDFVVDLTHAEEACEFAAGLLAAGVRRWGRLKRVRFRAASAEHARILAGHGLEIEAEEPAPDRALGIAVPAPGEWPLTTSGASA